MRRIERVFEEVKKRGRAALIPFIMSGDPDLDTTAVLVRRLAQNGADMIELGVPYSDPLADGPTIQAAAQRALQKGVTLKNIFGLAQKMTDVAPPLILMTYFNPVFHYGLNAFAEDCSKSGIAGVIIPDLPPEEAGPWKREAREWGVDTIFLAAPTSPPERLKLVSKLSTGFIYYVSLTGVTGARGTLPEELEAAVRRVKKENGKPVAVGFGISTPEQTKEVSRFADGVIIGSAIVKIIAEEEGREGMIHRVGNFVSAMAEAVQ